MLGAAFAVASPERWRAIIVALGPASLTLLAASLFSPENHWDELRDLWYLQPLTQATFQSVVFVLKVFGLEAAPDRRNMRFLQTRLAFMSSPLAQA